MGDNEEPAAGAVGGQVQRLPLQESSGLPPFDPKGEPTTLSVRWKKWKRAFNLYVVSRGINEDKQKVALLLHTGGIELQEVYYTLVDEEAEKTFDQCLKILDDYLKPQSNVLFERHLFRQMEQLQSESVDQFICRLRQKASLCEFDDVDIAIRDQLIEKCKNSSIRRKFLQQSGDDITLKKLQDLARAHESVEQQLREMERGMEANSISHNGERGRKRETEKQYQGPQTTEKRCYRCNRTGHYAKDEKCPAKGKTCTKCKRKGHFAICCKTKPGTSNSPRKTHGKNKTEKAYHVEPNKDNDDYAFVVNSKQSTDDLINLTVGGVQLPSVMIDSGASCNLVDKTTWEMLKSQGIKCQSRVARRKLFAYGQQKPLDIIGVFQAEIGCDSSGHSCTGEFTVINGSGRPLLGKDTAKQLDILRLGPTLTPHVYMIEGDGDDIKRKFSAVFSGVGKLKNYQLKLHIKDIPPVAQPVRRLPFGLRDKVDKQLQDLLAKDIIEEVSNGPTEWVSPLVVVPKPNGDVRICVDMRRANEAIVRERHPIPTVEEVIYDLNGATVFSKLDLKWGFHQIELEKASRNITTFVTHQGLFRYKRLMFGISSAPEKYQKIVQDTVRGCKGVANIADDLIVYGSNLEQHDKNLQAILQRMEDCGLTLNPQKCEFRLSKLTFFGHSLSKHGIEASDEKIAGIRDAKPPTHASEVRSFLGLAQYSAKFIPTFAEVAEPLRLLTRKSQSFIWEKDQQQSFQELKRLLTSAEVLAYFREDCPTRIVADAGPTGLGAVLTQRQGDTWRPISYASRNLTEVERRYSQTEKEALALVWACERFNLYVCGRQFELETDHKPLQYMFSKTSKLSARVERWVLRLQGYDYKVVYRPGKTNIADVLSRLNSHTSKDTSGDTYDVVRMIAQASTPQAITAKEVEIESGKDPELALIRECILTGNWSSCKLPQYVCIKDELCTYGQLIMRGHRMVIPQSLQPRILQLSHEGHQGVVKTKQRLRSKVWWPKMDAQAERLCKTCHGCQTVGASTPPEPLQRVVPPSGPWQDCAADLLGPLPTGEHLLVIVDYYSRYFEVVIMRSTTSTKVIQALQPIFARFGIPFSLRTDNGSQLVSEEFLQFLVENGVEHRTTTPLWPQANGEVERQNRSLMKALRIAKVEGKDWRTELSQFLTAYRSTPHTTTGATPYYMMFGREMKSKLPDLRREKSTLDEAIRDKDWYEKLKGKVYSDEKRHAAHCPIQAGDQVLLKNQQTDKMSPKYIPQPYQVLLKNGGEVTVRNKEGRQLRRSITHVKKYEQPQTIDNDTEVIDCPSTEMSTEKPEPSTGEQEIRKSTRISNKPKHLADYKCD